MTIHIRYFAMLQEQAGRTQESFEIATPESTGEYLFQLLSQKYHFALTQNLVKIAINDEFRDWRHPVRDGDRVVFIPPVAGG